MLKKIPLLFHTLRNLKPIQIKYQILYRLKKAKPLNAYKDVMEIEKINYLSFIAEPPVYQSYLGENTFNFLNLQHHFPEQIDWQFQEYGALWNYNLQYLNLLLQEDIVLAEKLQLLDSIYNSGIILEPYPVSLRSINVMRLFSKEKVEDETFLENLFAELSFLSNRLEYHLLANHLLENAFALFMGGVFFAKQEWIKQGQKLLQTQLNEQILKDGAHYELSPMYHQIIFFRLLELIDWYSSWDSKQNQFEQFLREKASRMWAWLKNISFRNGDIPHFNDSTEGISYSTKWLSKYAEDLKIKKINLPLSDSGYRKKDTSAYECRVDFAQIGPSYQPGHAHADALSFILYDQEHPLFVEQGTSTYNISKKRSAERSTQAHNTVVVNGKNQSQVWGGFRVAKRAHTEIVIDKENQIKAQHDGYRPTIHQRTFDFEEQSLQITDQLSAEYIGIAYFHLHPLCEIKQLDENSYQIKDGATIVFNSFDSIKIEFYQLAKGYNQYQKAKRFAVVFNKTLTTIISVK